MNTEYFVYIVGTLPYQLFSLCDRVDFSQISSHVVHVSAVSDMKNAVIGNNKQKANLIVLGAVPRFVSSFLLTATFSQGVIFEDLE